VSRADGLPASENPPEFEPTKCAKCAFPVGEYVVHCIHSIVTHKCFNGVVTIKHDVTQICSAGFNDIAYGA